MDIFMQHACIDIDINDHDIDITYMHRYRYRNTNIHSQILKDHPAVYHTARNVWYQRSQGAAEGACACISKDCGGNVGVSWLVELVYSYQA